MNYECLRAGGETSSELFVYSIGITCNGSCPQGFALQYSDRHCCPQCVQAMCRFNDRFYGEGESWPSVAGCLRYRCVKEGGLLSIISSRKECPMMMDCPWSRIAVACVT